jgi:amino acid adenylation domain-containing protein
MEGVPLSPQQRRLWLISGGAGPTRAAALVRLSGAVSPERLRGAVERVVARHEILRTTFEIPYWLKVPLQVIHGEGQVRWREIEAPAGEPAPGRALAAAAAMAAEPQRPPALEVTLLRADGAGAYLLLALPALCADPWSLDEMVRQIADEYGGAATAGEVVQYADYAVWQEELESAAGGEAAIARALWQRWRSGGGVPHLPGSAGEGGAGPFEPRAVALGFQPQIDALRQAEERLQIPARELLLAAWMAFVCRLAERYDLPVASLLEGRPVAELRQGLGLYARHLPVRARLEDNPPFPTLAERVQRALEEAESVQAFGVPDEVPAWTVLFEPIRRAPTPCQGDVRFSLERRWIHPEPFALKLSFTSGAGEAALELHFDHGRFSDAAALGVAYRWRRFLSGLLAQPEQRIDRPDALGQAERHALLVEAGACGPPAGDRCFHQLVAGLAASRPDEVAVACEDERFTRGEIDRRANLLARQLRALGVGPESRVGLLTERSPRAVIGLLGILTAGGAYTPFDPSYPRARLQAMLDDSGARVVVTEPGSGAALPPGVVREVVLDDGWEEVAAELPATPPPGAAAPGHLAYVLFTSGSTGRPKGVAVEHRQVTSYLAAIRERLRLPSGATYATVTTFAADLGHTVILPALAGGGCLHVLRQRRIADPAALADYFERTPVDCLKIVPSHLAALLLAERPGRLLPRARLVLGGEACAGELAARIGELAGRRLRVFNHYGPTETTVGVACGEMEGLRKGPAVPPLGRPLAGNRLYLLGRRLNLVPTDGAGVLHVGGTQVARGYLGRPAATAAAFLPDPWSPLPGARMYATGDRVRRRATGELYFQGRADDQVKLRGFRIEPGEVEAALLAHQEVAEAVVLARQEGGGGPRLVGYAVPRPGARLDPEGLRRSLQLSLPEYMVPSTIVALEALPLTANGKLDRGALPAASGGPAAGESDRGDRPRGPVEEGVASIWGELLGRERIGVRDDFFQLGGHSLLATRALSRLRRTFGVELPLEALFEDPTVAGIAARVEERMRSGDAVASPPIAPVPRRPGGLPLSPGQQRLWFLHRLDPANPAYHIALGLRVEGPFDLRALGASLGDIERRHEVLRTTYPLSGELPLQRIRPPAPSPLPRVALAPLNPERPPPPAARLAAEEARRPFDLEAGPVWRRLVVRLGGGEHAVLLTLHHIASDGWSRGLLTRELAALYRARVEGRPSPLAPLPIQYADYAAWQRACEASAAWEPALAYWRRALEGLPAALDLPLDRPRPAVQSSRGGRVTLALEPPVWTGLRRLGEGEAATQFMVVLALYQAVLARSAGAPDVAVGTPVANRTRSEVENLIGFFVNTLTLRVLVDEKLPFPAFLRRVRTSALGAYGHQDLPFEKLVEELRPERSLSHTPLFQVMLLMQELPGEELRSPGLTFSSFEAAEVRVKFDLSLGVAAAEDRLLLILEYNADLFDRTTARRFLGRLRRVAEAAVMGPDLPLERFPDLAAAERHQLLAEWADTAVSWDLEASLHALCEERAAASPEAVALAGGDQRLSYRELDARAAGLAFRILDLGAGPGSLVGVAMERSPELVMALLGCLKAGAAYLPIDPRYPASRLAFMLEDAAVAALLTQPHLAADLPPVAMAAIALEEGWNGAGVGPGPRRALPTPPAGLAYAIYTSGSTGRPKGVLVPHRGIVNRLRWMQQAYRLSGEDRVLQKTPFTFDVSVWEFFWPLLAGATLVICPPGRHGDAAFLADLMARERITVLHFVPSMLRPFLDASREASLDAVRQVIASGEALGADLVSAFYRRLPRGRLDNLYGPTEASVDVTSWPCPAGRGGPPIPIGRPIANAEIRVVAGSGMRPAPVGVPGELLIGGVGLARGYLARPGLTAERFVPDPLGAEPGGRLYRSGDRARFLAGGEIEYLGRGDQQVKVRGFRIELGEIEAALLRHPGLRQAVVVARSEAEHGSRLVAYLVPTGEAAPPLEELRDLLASSLPEPMIPARFVVLDALPLTASGKVDRRALPAPEAARPALAAAYVPPRTAVEEVLAAIWGRVLAVERVGVHDNFFALGGDSIRSIQVLGQARLRGLVLDLPDFFRRQTIAGLAGLLERQEERAAGVPPEPFDLVDPGDLDLLPPDLEDAYPLTRLQAGMLFHMELAPSQPVFHNVNSWRLHGRLEPAAFRRAVQQVVARHAILRTSFDLLSFGEPLQLVHRRAILPVRICDLAALSPGDQDRVIAGHHAAEEQRRFDLSRPPLIRFLIHPLGDGSFQFTLAENHAIQDGWSLHSTLSEVFERYLRLLGGEDLAEGPALATSFRRYVGLERQAVGSEEQRRFWQGKVQDLPPLTLPPHWGSSDGDPRSRVRNVEVAVRPDLLTGLRGLARQVAVPLKSVLLAAHLRVLTLVTGQEEVVSGLLLHGRPEEPDGDRVRGLFLNVLPLRVRAGGSPFVELALRSFAAEREILPYRRFPLLEIQRLSGNRRLVEVEFNFINFHVVEEVLEGGEIAVLPGPGGRLEQTDMALATSFRLSPLDARLSINLRYDSRRLARCQVRRIARQYLAVLEAAVAAPEHRGGGLLAAGEAHQLAVEWTDTGRPPAPAGGVQELFREQASVTPERVATLRGGEHWSYAGLRRRAGRLARTLRREGVGPEVGVGLLLPGSPLAVAAVLAVLEAGGWYVAVSPDAAPGRLAAVQAAAAPRLWLTAGAQPGAEPAAGVGLLDLAGDWEEDQGGDAAVAPPPSDLTERLAYLVFTSGSSGRRKGIQTPHRAALNYLGYLRGILQSPPVERVLQLPDLGFDASVRDILGPLILGATVVFAEQREVHDPASLLQVMVRQRVESLLSVVPTLLRALVEAAAAEERPPRLRRLFAAGETLRGDDCTLVRRRFGGELEVANLYGPTECTMTSSHFRIPLGWSRPGAVPVGRPISGVRFYLVSRGLELLPQGAEGEVVVAGAGLARGYAGQRALTAAGFVPDPFAATPGGRLYRTGDLGRWTPGGQLELVGRIDAQVKIRGVRVEPGETEALLRQHPGVAEAAVVAREDRRGELQLVAYLVSRQAVAPSVGELRAFLRDRVPDQLLPGAFVFSDSLARTANGKLDRRALPAPPEERAELAVAFEPPRSPREATIAEIWSAVLRVGTVGVFDDFFELGGHSLLAAQVIGRMRSALGLAIPLAALFERPTVAGLAELVAALEAEREAGAAAATELAPAAGGDLAAIADEISDEDLEALLGAASPAGKGGR